MVMPSMYMSGTTEMHAAPVFRMVGVVHSFLASIILIILVAVDVRSKIFCFWPPHILVGFVKFCFRKLSLIQCQKKFKEYRLSSFILLLSGLVQLMCG